MARITVTSHGRLDRYRMLGGIPFKMARAVYLACFKWNPLGRPVRAVYLRVYQFFPHLVMLKDIRRDRRYGVDTRGFTTSEGALTDTRDAHGYFPTPYAWIDRLLNAIPMGPEDTFIDIGCGKGRVTLCASLRKIHKAMGIDILPDLIEIAKQNGKNMPTDVPIEFICGNASTCDMSEPTVFYFFNPFGAPTMEMVLANIRKSLEVRPRPVRIVYTYPIYAEVMEKQDWLVEEPIKGPGDPRMWRSTLPVPSAP